jgi:hypothetical protein
MSMPGFTAELSLRETSERCYFFDPPTLSQTGDKVVPQARVIERCVCIPNYCHCWLMMVFDDGTAISIS